MLPAEIIICFPLIVFLKGNDVESSMRTRRDGPRSSTNGQKVDCFFIELCFHIFCSNYSTNDSVDRWREWHSARLWQPKNCYKLLRNSFWGRRRKKSSWPSYKPWRVTYVPFWVLSPSKRCVRFLLQSNRKCAASMFSTSIGNNNNNNKKRVAIKK